MLRVQVPSRYPTKFILAEVACEIHSASSYGGSQYTYSRVFHAYLRYADFHHSRFCDIIGSHFSLQFEKYVEFFMLVI